MPSAPSAVETTARPAPKASRIFRRVPPPLRSGTSTTDAPASSTRMSATGERTSTPAASSSARTSGSTSRPATTIRTPGTRRRRAVAISRAIHCAAATLGP